MSIQCEKIAKYTLNKNFEFPCFAALLTLPFHRMKLSKHFCVITNFCYIP